VCCVSSCMSLPYECIPLSNSSPSLPLSYLCMLYCVPKNPHRHSISLPNNVVFQAKKQTIHIPSFQNHGAMTHNHLLLFTYCCAPRAYCTVKLYIPVIMTVLMLAERRAVITGAVSGLSLFCIIIRPANVRSHSTSSLYRTR